MDTRQQWVVQQMGNYAVTSVVPRVSLSCPLVYHPQAAYAVLSYKAERSTCHRVVCYGCREKFKLYDMCVQCVRYVGPTYHQDMRGYELSCIKCRRSTIIVINKHLIYGLDNLDCMYLPKPMYRFKSQL